MFLADPLRRPAREASQKDREKAKKVKGHVRSRVRGEEILYDVMIDEIKT